MVSPLQVWKHPEPKGLWPAVSGLAILTHIGILGFSLPYVIEIMQPAQGRQTAAIPVELIVEEGATSAISEPSQQESANSSDDSSEESLDSSAGSAAKATSPTADQIETTAPAATEALTSQSDSVVSSVEPQARNAQPQNSSTEPVNRNVEQSATKSETSTDPTDLDVADSVSDDLYSQNSDSQNSSDAPIEPDNQDTLPVLSGDREIPTPDRELAGSDLPQTAYLKIVSHSYVPRSLLQDIATTSPQPIYEEITAVELQPQDVNCERVDFSQSQVTYRITVNKDGSMRDASPWTGSIAERPPLNAEERAIACLLLASGFRFIPATFEGELVVNESLLLTINLIESQPK